MNTRRMLVLVSVPLDLLSATACGKGDPRTSFHAEAIGDSGYVIDLPGKVDLRQPDRTDKGTFDIRYERTSIDGHVWILADKVPNEEWAISACGGSNATVTDIAGGGRAVTCFENASSPQWRSWAWVPLADGNIIKCEHRALGQDDAARNVVKRSCPSIRKK